MSDSVCITLHGESPTSWNKFYAGKHWSSRRNEAQRVHMLVRSLLDPDADTFNVPVDIELRVYFKNKRLQQDASNIAAKLYEDGLVGWVIEDDSPEHVRSMKTVSLIDRKQPRVEIIVRPTL